jgi:hypothetical protein
VCTATRFRRPRCGARPAAIRAFAAKHEGLVFEDKGASVALHYRLAPQLASAAHSVVRKAAHAARRRGRGAGRARWWRS